MPMTCIAAMIGAASAGLALFGGISATGTMMEQVLSLVLAGLTAVAVTSAAELDL